MMAITHDEIRRHPRWRAEMDTPAEPHPRQRSWAWVIWLAALVLAVTAAVLLLTR
jgi:hypothetical protein